MSDEPAGYSPTLLYVRVMSALPLKAATTVTDRCVS